MEQTAEPISESAADDALKRLEGFVEKVGSISTLKAQGSTRAGNESQFYDFDLDVSSNSFAGDVTVREGKGTAKAELIRTSETTWLRAGDDYWRSQGFDADSVKRAHGKYVVFNDEVGSTIAKQYNLGAVFSSLAKVKAEKATVLGDVDFDGVKAQRFEYQFGEESMLIDLTKSADRVRMISTSADALSTFVMSDFDGKVDISVPDPDKVMQAPQD